MLLYGLSRHTVFKFAVLIHRFNIAAWWLYMVFRGHAAFDGILNAIKYFLFYYVLRILFHPFIGRQPPQSGPCIGIIKFVCLIDFIRSILIYFLILILILILILYYLLILYYCFLLFLVGRFIVFCGFLLSKSVNFYHFLAFFDIVFPRVFLRRFLAFLL